MFSNFWLELNSLREFPENCVYNLNCFIEYFQRKLFTANILSYDIANAKNVHLLDLYEIEVQILIKSTGTTYKQ
jgi:lysophospholipase L1-like esterase